MITISPITDIVPLGGSPTEVELAVISGYHTRSYLTFVKEFLPCDAMKLREIPGVKRVFTVRDRAPQGLDLFIFISTDESTQVLIPLKPGQFDEASADKYDFERDLPTLASFSVSDNNILQLTSKKLLLLTP